MSVHWKREQAFHRCAGCSDNGTAKCPHYPPSITAARPKTAGCVKRKQS